LSAWKAAALGLLCAGCGAGLQLRRIDSTYERPSNVAVYFTVDTDDGDPVPGLAADAFKIYEDGALVSAYESRQTILNPQVAAVHYTLLLVDMSASMVESGQVPQLVAAADAFTTRVGAVQQVAVYTFDGREDIQEVVGFTRSESGASTAIRALENRQVRDPSTNLHGAVVKGLEVLRAQMDRSTLALRFGTLVVFTDGTDRAGRVSKDAMLDAVDTSGMDVYAIAVGGEIDEDELTSLGRNGFVRAASGERLQAAFDEVARKIEGYSKRFYLLSYCSPARAGEHEVTIEASSQDATGSISYTFVAEGFGPGCDPTRPPNFGRARPAATEAPEE
jgi:hypothetical protein